MSARIFYVILLSFLKIYLKPITSRILLNFKYIVLLENNLKSNFKSVEIDSNHKSLSSDISGS